MKYFFQILGTGSGDMNPSSILFFDHARFLFNCGEGSQRFFCQHKVKLNKINTVFLTRLSWDRCGGIPGLILSAADSGSPYLRIFGPKGTTFFVASLSSFIRRSSFPLSVSDLSISEQNIGLDPISVNALFLFPENTKNRLSTEVGKNSDANSDSSKDINNVNDPVATSKSTGLDSSCEEYVKYYTKMFAKLDPFNPPNACSFSKKRPKFISGSIPNIGDVPGSLSSLGFPRKLDEYHSPGLDNCEDLGSCEEGNDVENDALSTLKIKEKNSPPGSLPSDIVICYFIKGPNKPGKFLADKAAKLGVFGAKRGNTMIIYRLSLGHSVTMPGGKVVRPEDCISPESPGKSALYLDIPSPDYLKSLYEDQRKFFSSYQSGDGKENNISLIVHILGEGIIQRQDYQNWILSFGSSTCHIVVDQSLCPQEIVFTSSSLLQQFLKNIIDKRMFSSYYPPPENRARPSSFMIDSKEVHIGRPLLSFELEPSLSIDNAGLDHLSLSGLLQGAPSTDASLASSHFSQLPDDFELAFLGTGSAIPSKYRNVSGIYLDVNKVGGILLDCGEGTLGQLFRKYGPTEFSQRVLNLSLIFISHMHADHHMGIVGILTERFKMMTGTNHPVGPLTIVGPKRLGLWIKKHSEIENIAPYVFMESKLFKKEENSGDSLEHNEEILCKRTALGRFQTVPVIHIHSSFGLMLETPSGLKLAYSGDTRPCGEFAELGKSFGVDILIHEATFEHDLQDQAEMKNHSTWAEAIDVASQMDVSVLLLSHFSQRYPISPPAKQILDMHSYSQKCTNPPKFVSIVFDMMTLRLPDIDSLNEIQGKFAIVEDTFKSRVPDSP